MRRAIASAVLGVMSAGALTAASLAPAAAKAPPPGITVHLDGPADLDQLRATNFNHYLRARKILAAADEICRPRPLQLYLARFHDADPHCGFMLMTSYPPKKVLTFHLDTVHYIALVTLTHNRAKLLAIDAKR